MPISGVLRTGALGVSEGQGVRSSSRQVDDQRQVAHVDELDVVQRFACRARKGSARVWQMTRAIGSHQRGILLAAETDIGFGINLLMQTLARPSGLCI